MATQKISPETATRIIEQLTTTSYLTRITGHVLATFGAPKRKAFNKVLDAHREATRLAHAARRGDDPTAPAQAADAFEHFQQLHADYQKTYA
ncbi:hypothetical protein [Saccharopolyspora taberi]|uniref:Uncharacterized protein n=1 Tax=Saccharopolyspora taberi TaxID=60895 RepID=A0ABN3V4N0_9PSEU